MKPAEPRIVVPGTSPGDPAIAVTVMVNGQAHALSRPVSLEALLALLGLAPESVAVAVDGDFVPRSCRASWQLRGGEQVSCFKPIVGG